MSWAKQRAYEAIAETALGNLDRASAILDDVAHAELPFTTSSEVRTRLLLAAYLLWSARDDGWRAVIPFRDDFVAAERNVSLIWSDAKIHARRGDHEAAAADLELAVPLLPTYPAVAHFSDLLEIHDVIEACWLAGIEQHRALAGRLVDERLAPDLRGPMTDMRLCKAGLAALGGDAEEAGRWFAESRVVLDEAGARPLRAIVDLDEATMHHRLVDGDDRLRARLLDAAILQFTELGMTGWLCRASALVAAAAHRN